MQEKTKLFLNRIKRLQGKTLLTQGELLQKIGISKAMLSFIRNEKHPPSVKILRRLAQMEITEGIEAPITQATTMGEVADMRSRTGESMAAYMAPSLLEKEIQRLKDAIEMEEARIQQSRETIKSYKETLNIIKKYKN